MRRLQGLFCGCLRLMKLIKLSLGQFIEIRPKCKYTRGFTERGREHKQWNSSWTMHGWLSRSGQASQGTKQTVLLTTDYVVFRELPPRTIEWVCTVSRSRGPKWAMVPTKDRVALRLKSLKQKQEIFSIFFSFYLLHIYSLRSLSQW